MSQEISVKRWCVLCFSKCNVYSKYVGILLKCRFWFSSSGMGPESRFVISSQRRPVLLDTGTYFKWQRCRLLSFWVTITWLSYYTNHIKDEDVDPCFGLCYVNRLSNFSSHIMHSAWHMLVYIC